MQRETSYNGKISGAGSSLKKALADIHNQVRMDICRDCDWKYDSIIIKITIDRIEICEHMIRYADADPDPSYAVDATYTAIVKEYL